jgi:hypothetical protein
VDLDPVDPWQRESCVGEQARDGRGQASARERRMLDERVSAA